MNNFKYFDDHEFELNRDYIGASDIPTLALMNTQYGQTPLTLWETITGRRESFKGNERTKAGKELEPIVLKWGLEKLEWGDSEKGDNFINLWYLNRIKNQNSCAYFHNFTEAFNPKRSYLKCHADLINEYDQPPYVPYIMEAKTTGFFGGIRKDNINIGYDKDNLSANGIPSAVYLQIQTQMLCYDIPTAYVSVMIDTGIHRLYGPIPAHKKTQEKILAIAQKFWWYVENDKPPMPKTWSDIVHLFPNLDKESKTVIAGLDEEKVIEMKDRAKKLRKKSKDIEEELKDIKNGMGLILGKNAILETASGRSLAKAFEVTKEYAKLTELKKKHIRKYNILKKDGFITETTSRQMRY